MKSISYALMGASIPILIVAALILIMPWVFKFMDWYFPWVATL